MYCDYCRRLFELRQKVEPYTPPQKGLAGVSTTPSAPWLQARLQLEQELEERERSEETHKERGRRVALKETSKERPKLEIYEDAEDLFTPRLLWWKVPIEKEGFKSGDSHVPNAECQICKMIFSNISAPLVGVLLKKNNQENNSIAFVYQLKSTTDSKRTTAGEEALLSIWLEIGQELLPMVKLQVMKKLRIPRCLPYSHVESTNTGSMETLALAASWIRDCNLLHPKCSLARNRGRKLPTRLIHVGTADGAQNPHLWIPEHPTKFVQYVALSYRWTESTAVTLTKASQASLCKEIPLDLLPQSNQDAIKIARHLGIKYLWIDILCILQDLDDVSDWLRESSCMSDIYKFAYVTISASQASTGKEGCFAEHQPLEARLVQSHGMGIRPKLERDNHAPIKPEDHVDSATSDLGLERLEAREVSTLESINRKLPSRVLEDENVKFVPMTRISMLSPEETVLELLLRQEIDQNPHSKLLRSFYDGLRKVQRLREKETLDMNNELAPVDPIPPLSMKDLILSGKEMIEGDDLTILARLRENFFQVEKWRTTSCSSWDNHKSGLTTIPQRIFPPDNRIVSFIPMVDVSLLPLEDRQQEEVLRKKIAQNPEQVALYHQYNQLQRYQWQREFIRDEMESELVIKALQMDLWATEVDASPLSRRAWTLQERLLSTRVLHFTQSQLFWECQSAKACETWPKLELKYSTPNIPTHENNPKPVRPLDGAALTPLEEHWEEIVELYTDANLTKPEDKLVAISGLAKEVQERTKDLYYAGLWGKSFTRGLLYCLEIPQQLPSFNYRAPSWSWASVNGKVNFISKRQNDATPASTIQSIWTFGIDGKRGSTGQIKSGSFYISAPTIGISRYETQGNSYRLILTEELSESDRASSAEFFPDTMTKTFPTDAICLPIIYYREATIGLQNKRDSWLAGLLVQPTGDFHDEYRRLGVFRMSEQSGRMWFEGLAWRTMCIV